MPAAKLAAEEPPMTIPPADTFALLTPLHPLLSQLLVDGPTSSPDEANTSATDLGLTATVAGSGDKKSALSPKDFATAASAFVGAKIQHARRAVSALEGIDVSVAEQERIIAELESEVARREAVLKGISDFARTRLDAQAAGGADRMEE